MDQRLRELLYECMSELLKVLHRVDLVKEEVDVRFGQERGQTITTANWTTFLMGVQRDLIDCVSLRPYVDMLFSALNLPDFFQFPIK